MSRLSIGLLLILSLVACSSGPTSGESSRAARAAVAPPSSAVAATQAAAVPPPDPRESALAATVLHLLEREHLLHKKVDDEVSRQAFQTYLERLDGSKMFLLRSDADALARHVDRIDDELRAGSLELAHQGAKLFVARVAVVEKMVEKHLAAPLDLTNEEWFELDPDKVELAASDRELSERWRGRLELEVLERIGQMEARLEASAKKPAAKGPARTPHAGADADAGDGDLDEGATVPLAEIPTTPEGREAKARAELAKTYAGRFARLKTAGPLDAAADVVNAVATVLDPHTVYLPPADKANFDIQMSGSLEGIGAVLREKDHYTEVVELVPGGASWRHGGLAPGDLILAVAAEGKPPVDVFDLRIDEVVKMIRGPKGTVVQLRVRTKSGEEQTVSITRDVVVIEESYARGAVLTRKGLPAFGYVHLPSFYGGQGDGKRAAADDVKRLLEELRTRKVRGLVLDLRSNGGGLLGDAIELTGHLIDRGPVVQVHTSRGEREVLGDDEPGVEFDGPLVVLVDRFSASASEIVAGALQDYNRAIVVGTGPTHGKGTVQTLADLDRATGGSIELGVLKITIQQFFRVSGSSTQREGVVPDIVLPDPAGHIDTGERELDHAIPWSQVAAAKHEDWPATWKPSALLARSTARVLKHPVLAKIATATQVLRARRDDTRVPLAQAAWEARRKEQRAALEAASPDLSKAPARITIKPLTNGSLSTAAPSPNGKTDDRMKRWSDGLARDPWIEECLYILADMAKG